MKKTKVTFLTSVGGGVFGESLVRELRVLGVDIELDYLISLADYWKQKSKRLKFRLRFGMYVGYPMKAFFSAFFVSKRVYVVTTNPFFLPLLMRIPARIRGHKTVNLIYDLYPEALIHGGNLTSNSWVARVCAWITRSAVKWSDASIYLSPRFGDYIESKYGPSPCPRVIAVGASGDPFESLELRHQDSGDVTFLYSGHMGRLHDSGTIAELILKASPVQNEEVEKRIQLKFCSNGPAYEAFLAKIQDHSRVLLENGIELNLDCGRNLPDAEWVNVMRSADVAVVTLVDGGQNVVMPSKSYSALLAGQALLAICPRESDLADLVIDNDIGWHVEVGAVNGLKETLSYIASNPDELLEKRRRAYAFSHEHFSMKAVAKEYKALIDRLMAN